MSIILDFMDQAQFKRRVYKWAECVPQNANLRKQYGNGPFTEQLLPRRTNIDNHLIYIFASDGSNPLTLAGIPRVYLELVL